MGSLGIFTDPSSKISSSNSLDVGNLKPTGQGLLNPLAPCHNWSFWILIQSFELFVERMNSELPGEFLVDNFFVVLDLLSWCPSEKRPHWYKYPNELDYKLDLATSDAPKFRSIQILPVLDLTSTTIVFSLSGTWANIY